MPIEEHFLYSTMVEGDGHLRNEPTFAGAILIVAVGTLIALIVAYVILTLFAFL